MNRNSFIILLVIILLIVSVLPPSVGSAQTRVNVVVVGTYSAPANKAIYSITHDDSYLYIGLATNNGSDARAERIVTTTMTYDGSYTLAGHESIDWAAIYVTGNYLYMGAFNGSAQIGEFNKNTTVNTRVFYGQSALGQDNITSITGQGRYLYVTYDVSTGPGGGGRIDKIDTLSIFPNMAVTATWYGTATQAWPYTSYFNESDGYLYAGVHNTDGYPGVGPSLYTPTIVKINPNPVGTTTMTHSQEWNGAPDQKFIESTILKHSSTGNLYFNFQGWLGQNKPNGILELNPTTVASVAYWGGSLNTTAVLANEIDDTDTYIYLVTDQTPFRIVRLVLPLSALSNDSTWTAPTGTGMQHATRIMKWGDYYYVATGTPTGGKVFKLLISEYTILTPAQVQLWNIPTFAMLSGLLIILAIVVAYVFQSYKSGVLDIKTMFYLALAIVFFLLIWAYTLPMALDEIAR